MFPVCVLAFLLGFSVVSPLNFSTVYEWEFKEMDYSWTTEPIRTTALKEGAFKPEEVNPLYVAVYRDERLFLSLSVPRRGGIPVSLVSLPTSTAFSTPPKLDPYPNWLLHKKDGCSNRLKEARGLEVGSDGRLWVLDRGSDVENCKAKLWIFDLADGAVELAHQVPDAIVSPNYRDLHDVVLDETPDDTFAYMVELELEHVIVFSRSKQEMWLVKTPGKDFESVALSPATEGATRQLYLRRMYSKELCSVSVDQLRANAQSVALKLISERTGPKLYRMLIDNANVLYAAFTHLNHISTWTISNFTDLSKEHHIYEAGKLASIWPFAFALDTSGTLWLVERNENGGKPKHKLLKAAVGAKSYLHRTPSTTIISTDKSTTSSTTPGPVQKSKKRSRGCGSIADDKRQGSVLINILICLVHPCNSAGNLQAGKLQNSDKQQEAKEISVRIPEEL